MFFDMLLTNSIVETPVSLERTCITIENEYNVSMKKQSLDERFNENALLFVKSMFEEQLKRQIVQPATNFLSQFKRVILSDSSRFDVPANFKDKLPGFSGRASSPAGISMQFSFDIKAGEVTDLSLVPAVTSDSKYISQKRDSIREEDLYIRDLGYYSTELLSFIDHKGAFYCSRLNSKVNAYYMQESQFKLLSFKKFLSQMKRQKLNQMELEVFIGEKERMKTRLIIEVVPDIIYAKRIKKLNYYNKHNGHQTSQEQKSRMRFNLFITNVPSASLATEQVHHLYKIRWQIELRFKILKSTFALDKLPKMKYYRYLCLLYAKLLLVFIYYEIIINVESALCRKELKKISFDKAFKTLKNLSLAFIKILLKKTKSIKHVIKKISGILERNHWLDSKKNRIGMNELSEIFG